MSTIKVTNVQNPSAASAAITLDTNGQATLNGLAYPTAGPLSNRNLIINGAMQVAQRGTSTATLGYLLDRFNTGWSQGAVTTSQESLTSGNPYNEGFRYFMRQQNTTSSTDVSAYRHLTQRIEAQNIAQSGWNYVSSSSYITLSFWARASVAQSYYVQLQTDDGTQQKYSFSFSLSANTWTKITKTIPGSSNITVNNDNGWGLDIKFIPYYGTNYTDSGSSDNVWEAYSSTSQLPDMSNTWANTTNATFDITGVQLEVGSVATPFEHRSYADELALCKRYYQKYTALEYRSYCNNVVRDFKPLPVTMRANPITTNSGWIGNLGQNNITGYTSHIAVDLSISPIGSTGVLDIYGGVIILNSEL